MRWLFWLAKEGKVINDAKVDVIFRKSWNGSKVVSVINHLKREEKKMWACLIIIRCLEILMNGRYLIA